MKKFIILQKLMFGGWNILKIDATEKELVEFIETVKLPLSEYKFINGSFIEPRLSYNVLGLEPKKEEERTYTVPVKELQETQNGEENNQDTV